MDVQDSIADPQLAPGKFAGRIAVDGAPLLDVDKLRRTRGVLKAGRQIRLE